MFNLKSKLMVSALIIFTATSFADDSDPVEIARSQKVLDILTEVLNLKV